MLSAHQHPRSVELASLLPRLLLALLLIPLVQLHQRPALPPAPTAPAPAPSLPVAEQLGRLPLAFEPAAPGRPALFQARALGGTLFFAPGEVLLARPGSATLQVRFLGADPAAAVEPSDLLPGRVSRFIGDDPAHWQSDLPTSAALVYRKLYPGVDLRYDGASQRLKGTYLVAPGADPAPIRWRYDGAQGVRLDPGGDLLIALAASEAGGTPQTLAERAPVAWQDTATGRVPVGVAYDLAADGSVGFRLGRYDPALPLVIDPTLEFSSYFGGVGFDTISTLAFDQQGNIYAAGHTTLTGFRTHKPIQPNNAGGNDVVLLKLSPTGTTVLWSTYLGGKQDDWPARVLVDGQGIVLVGNTASSDFPAIRTRLGPGGGDRDFFVTRLNSQGTALLWTSILGGLADDHAMDAVLDGQGRITVSGATRSDNFPDGMGSVHQPAPNDGSSAVIAQLSADGQQLLFCTYLGGKNASEASAIALTADGSIVVGGVTQGDFPTKNPLSGQGLFPSQGQFQGGLTDAFVAKLTAGAGDLVWSTYLGGTGAEGIGDLVLDDADRIYATGTTSSVTFPQVGSTAPSQGEDGFISKLSADGQTLEYSSFLGGNREDTLGQIALDAQGNIYLLGRSNSEVLPLVNRVVPAPEMPSPVDRGFWPNLLLIKLSNDGRTPLIRTVLGGISSEIAGGMAVSPTGRVALSGHTDSDDLPSQNAIQPRPTTLLNDFDGMLMLIDTAPQLDLKGSSNPPVLPPCAADPCPPVNFAWTLDSPYRVNTTVAITLPPGLDVVPGSVSGATLSGKTLRAGGSPQPGSPQRVSYQARPLAGQGQGTMLTTLARASTPDGQLFERSLTVALPDPLPVGQERTLVLVYASGDNNLRDAMLLLANKVKRTAPTQDVVGLLVLDGPGSDDASLYNTLTKTSQHWPDSVANPNILADFLVSAQQAFPASRRVLSLVGHGGGWAPNVPNNQPDRHPSQPSRHGGQDGGNLGGMLWDDNPASSLSTIELASTLKTSNDTTSTTFDLLYLDACNMAQIEVAYQLRDSAHFLLASPNWKWAAFPYDEHLQDATKGDGLAIGKAWIANEQQALAEHKDEPYTFTLINLDQIGALRTQAETLARSLMDLPLPQEQLLPRIQTAFKDADRYDGNQDGVLDERDTTVDLGSFAARLEFELREQSNATPVLNAARQVQQALQSAVVEFSKLGGKPWLPNSNTWQWADTTTAGLPIYLPLGQQDDWRRRYYGSMDFGQDGNKDSAWATLVDWLWDGAAPPEDPVCGQPCVPLGPQLRPVALPRPIFLPLVRR
ncbi:MAG TPA: clostripain-related cysteine peptidase [Roseiflexaceae bacterium]|nr:clostripain-related cysteine peptidase [Roseiflexaceae bacterium]